MPKEGYKSVTVSDEMYAFISQMQQLLDVRGRAEVLDTLLADKRKQFTPVLNQLTELKKNNVAKINDQTEIQSLKDNVVSRFQTHNPLIIDLIATKQSLMSEYANEQPLSAIVRSKRSRRFNKALVHEDAAQSRLQVNGMEVLA